MAEVLGVVASGIAVTQGAQTVGQAALFLSRLWREVKDVPETIHNIVEELELAGKLVTAIEAELTNPVPSIGPDAGGPLTTIQCLTIQRCRQVHKDLENLVDDLAADIASSRKRKRLLAKAQVVLKKETLESYEKRLQKALRFLDSAVQLHLASSIKQQPRLIAAEVTNVWMSKTLLPPAEEAPPVSAEDTKEEKASSNDDEPEVLGSRHARNTHQNDISLRGARRDRSSTLLRLLGIEFEEQSEAPGASKSTSYRIRISPPQWLAAKTWDLQVSMACSGWTARLRHYVTVPSDSEVFRMVRSGTREQLFRLFDEGLASPYSVNEKGWTLLHHAMAHRRDLVVPLAQLGIDFCYKSRAASVTPCDLYYTLGSPLEHHDSAQDWAIHRLMLSHGVYDDILSIALFRDASYSLQGLVISQMTRSVELFDSFHTHVFPDLYQWPLEKRIENLRFNFSTWIPDAKAMARFFAPDGRFSPEHLRHRYRLAHCWFRES